MQEIEIMSNFLINHVPTFFLAILGYFLGHFLSLKLNGEVKRCEFILDELNKLSETIEESLYTISQSTQSPDFIKIVLNKQRIMSRKVDFTIKILEKYSIKTFKLKEYFDNIKSFLTGDEFSISASQKIDEQKLNQLKVNILGEIDDLKWETINKF